MVIDPSDLYPKAEQPEPYLEPPPLEEGAVPVAFVVAAVLVAFFAAFVAVLILSGLAP